LKEAATKTGTLKRELRLFGAAIAPPPPAPDALPPRTLWLREALQCRPHAPPYQRAWTGE